MSICVCEEILRHETVSKLFSMTSKHGIAMTRSVHLRECFALRGVQVSKDSGMINTLVPAPRL